MTLYSVSKTDVLAHLKNDRNSLWNSFKAFNEKCDSWPRLYWANNFTTVNNEAYNQYSEEVRKLEKEFYHNVLLGIVDLEDEWDNYVANMNKAGLDKIIAEYETLLAK